MSDDSPYLSIVVVSRNDDHGGDPLLRTQCCINSLYKQCNRFRIPTELIIIEWNPPQDRAGLIDVIQWPEDRQFINTRVITVPPEYHNTLEHSKKLHLFQMVGKNVGIRRAKGEYVLATNIDILFSDELMEYISKRKFQHGYYYRVDRFDVHTDVVIEPSENVMSYCRNHVIRVNIKLGTFFSPVVGKVGKFIIPFSDVVILMFDNRIIFYIRRILRNIRRISSGKKIVDNITTKLTKTCISIKNWPKIRNLILGRLGLVSSATNRFRSYFMSILSFFQKVLRDLANIILSVLHILRITAHSIISRFHVRSNVPLNRKNNFLMLVKLFVSIPKVNSDFVLPYLHFNSCGDFTLMAKKDWDALHGYSEAPIFSWNVDSLLLIDAYNYGIKEAYLFYPKVICHIEHSAGSGWTPGTGEKLLFERLEESGIPYISYQDCLDYARRWRETEDKKKFLNTLKKRDYGFIGYTFPETMMGNK
jgi:hypothetical protein